jgi:SulP family sulfate permease
MKRFIPFLTWIKSYDRKQFLGDLPAGITVGIMLIPQGMAYAMIAGLPEVYGLYAALFPQIVYAFLGTSRQLAVGPVAMDSLLVAAGLSVIATVGTEYYILLAISLALMVGIIQFLMGLFKLGFLVNFLSKPVISGFTSAAAIIIAMSQLKHLFGLELTSNNQVHILLMDVFQKLGDIHMLTFATGVAGIVIIKLLKRYLPKVPAALVVVVVGICVVAGFNFEEAGLQIAGEIPSGLPSFEIPVLRSEHFRELLPVALTLALIAFMEAVSVTKAIEQKHKDQKINANQELIALGASNIVGSFFQSYPTTGGFSRTAVNDEAGAKTGIAALISATVVGLTLLFLTPLFYNLPKALLASIIIVAVLRLIDFNYPLRLFRNRKEEFFLLIFTFLITLFVGIKEGILWGVVLSLLLLVYRTTKPHLAVLGRISGTKIYKNIDRFENAEERPGILIIRFDAQLYFANADYFKKALLNEISDRSGKLKLLIISCEAINYIDSSASSMLKRLLEKISGQDIQIYLSSAIGPLRDNLKKNGITEIIGEQHMFNSVEEAVHTFESNDGRDDAAIQIANQTNLS